MCSPMKQMRKPPATVRSPHSQKGTKAKDAWLVRKVYWRDVADLNSQTTVDDVPISQVPANDTPDTKTFVDVHISKPRLKPPDPNAYEVAPILSARPVQEIQ